MTKIGKITEEQISKMISDRFAGVTSLGASISDTETIINEIKPIDRDNVF
jgi:Uri superfamily endonuclease